MPVDYRLLRSWLFVPGDSNASSARCWDFPADALIVDLEDAVAADRKAIARGIAADAIAAAPIGGRCSSFASTPPIPG
jgi:citrate lyase subunit beta/citryl-CoA lyase